MAKEKISELAAAAALDGTELVPIVQGGETVQTTTQDIADLGGGGGITIPSLVAGDILVASGVNTLAALTIGSPTQQLRVNGGGTGLEYFTPSAASGDITNGGNTTGAAVTIGTNDDFGLNLETSGVTRMAITGGTGVGGQVTITNVTANTNTVSDGLTIQTNSTGTAAASFGGGILFRGESSTTDNQDMVRLSAIWTTATHASRASALVYSDVSAGGAIAERMRFSSAAINFSQSTTIGGNSNTVTIGGSSGQVNIGSSSGLVSISSSSTSTAGILLNPSNVSQAANVVMVGNTNWTGTSGDRPLMNIGAHSFAPTSGTAIYYAAKITSTINQTGGANGNTYGISVNPTLTAVGGTYYAIEIAANHASAKGIYQTGASTTNNFVGATHFGSTSAPNGAAAVEITSTTKGLLLPRLTTGERDAIGTPVAGLLIYNSTTGKLNVYTTAWEAVTSA